MQIKTKLAALIQAATAECEDGRRGVCVGVGRGRRTAVRLCDREPGPYGEGQPGEVADRQTADL